MNALRFNASTTVTVTKPNCWRKRLFRDASFQHKECGNALRPCEGAQRLWQSQRCATRLPQSLRWVAMTNAIFHLNQFNN